MGDWDSQEAPSQTPKRGTKLVVIQVFALASIGAKLVRYVSSMITKGRPRDYLTREEVRFTLALESCNPLPLVRTGS